MLKIMIGIHTRMLMLFYVNFWPWKQIWENFKTRLWSHWQWYCQAAAVIRVLPSPSNKGTTNRPWEKSGQLCVEVKTIHFKSFGLHLTQAGFFLQKSNLLFRWRPWNVSRADSDGVS